MAKDEGLEGKLKEGKDSPKANEPIGVNYGTYTLAKPENYKSFAKALASKGLGVGLVGRIFGNYEVIADTKDQYAVKVHTGKWSWYNRYNEAYEININKKTGEVSVKGAYAIKAPEAVLKADQQKFKIALVKLEDYLKKAEAPQQQQTSTNTPAPATPATPTAPAPQGTPAAVESIESYLQKIPQEDREEFGEFYNSIKAQAAKLVEYAKNPEKLKAAVTEVMDYLNPDNLYKKQYLPAKQQAAQQNRTPANAAGA